MLFKPIKSLRLNFFMSSFYAWLSDMVYRLDVECPMDTMSRYLNYMGIIQILEAVTYAPIVGGLLDVSKRTMAKYCKTWTEEVTSLRVRVPKINQ
jgi:hypothetical protein